MKTKNHPSSKELYEYYRSEGWAGHHQRKIYSNRQKALLLKKLKDLLDLIISDKVVLDVGCAEGWYTNWIGEKALFSVGIDISLPKLSRAIVESKSTKTAYVLGSWDYFPFQDSIFDIVFFSEGIEHSVDPYRTLSELERVMTQNGSLLLSVEIEPDNLYTRLVRKPLTKMRDHFENPFDGHLRIITPSLLRRLIGKYFRIKKEIRMGQSFDFPLKRTLGRLLGKRSLQNILILIMRKK